MLCGLLKSELDLLPCITIFDICARATAKAESDTDARDNPADVKTSKRGSTYAKSLVEEDEVDEAESTPTPRKRASKAQAMYVHCYKHSLAFICL